MPKNANQSHNSAPCMEYLPTFTPQMTQMLLNIPYMEHLGMVLGCPSFPPNPHFILYLSRQPALVSRRRIDISRSNRRFPGSVAILNQAWAKVVPRFCFWLVDKA